MIGLEDNMNWSIRYANESIPGLSTPFDSNGIFIPEHAFVGEGGSVYERTKNGMYIKTLHPLAEAAYKITRPGMYENPAQTYQNTFFAKTEGDALDASSMARHVGTRDAGLDGHGLTTLGLVRREILGADHPDLEELKHLPDHTVLGYYNPPGEKGDWFVFDKGEVSTTPIKGYKLFNTGTTWWGRKAVGEGEKCIYAISHQGHDVHTIFPTAKEAFDYAHSAEGIDKFRTKSSWGDSYEGASTNELKEINQRLLSEREARGE